MRGGLSYWTILVFSSVVIMSGSASSQTFPAGIWQSDGYSELVVVRDTTFKSYGFAGTSCIPRDSGTIAQYLSSGRLEVKSRDRVVVSGNYWSYPLNRVTKLREPWGLRPDRKNRRAACGAFFNYVRENYAFLK